MPYIRQFELQFSQYLAKMKTVLRLFMGPKIVDKRLPIKISAEAYGLLKHYSEVTGVPITKVITEAVQDWYEIIGITRIEKLTGSVSH